MEIGRRWQEVLQCPEADTQLHLFGSTVMIPDSPKTCTVGKERQSHLRAFTFFHVFHPLSSVFYNFNNISEAHEFPFLWYLTFFQIRILDILFFLLFQAFVVVIQLIFLLLFIPQVSSILLICLPLIPCSLYYVESDLIARWSFLLSTLHFICFEIAIIGDIRTWV